MVANVFLNPENTNPAVRVAAVTPNDSTDLPGKACRSLYIGGAGNVALNTVDGSNATFVALAAGSILPVCTARVLATGTTATSIVAMY